MGPRSFAAALPGVGLALLPKVTCPACWPAYAGLLTSAGLGFLLDVRWLLPATAASLLVALATLASGARRRGGLAPFYVGLAASAVVLLGKFALGLGSAVYVGVPLLAGASLWKGLRGRVAPGCQVCTRS